MQMMVIDFSFVIVVSCFVVSIFLAAFVLPFNLKVLSYYLSVVQRVT